MLSFEIRSARPRAQVQSKLIRPYLRHDPLVAYLQALLFHVHTAYLFICTDIPIIIITTMFGALTASVTPRLSMGPSVSFTLMLATFPSAFLWSWSNLFLFNLHNQRHAAAVAEDTLNKPWRPLPAGRITPQQADRVMYFMYPVTFAIACAFGGLFPCVLEAVLCLLYNERGGSSLPFLKNLMTASGLTCFLAGPLEVFTGHSVFAGDGTAALWLLLLAAAMTTTIHAQDFRDMEGDRDTGRRTVPLIMGDTNARALVGVGVVAWTYAASKFWGAGGRDVVPAWTTVFAMVGNLFFNRNMAGDRLTGKTIFPLWLLGMFMIPVLGR